MHICSPTALTDQRYTPHNAVLAWDITLPIETHFKSLHIFFFRYQLPTTPHPPATRHTGRTLSSLPPEP